MNFQISSLNFKLSKYLTRLLIKRLQKLERPLKSFKLENETIFVTVEKYSHQDLYQAKILVHVPPNHRSEIKEEGITPEEALNKAVFETKRVLEKYKAEEKDQHTILRRSKIKQE